MKQSRDSRDVQVAEGVELIEKGKAGYRGYTFRTFEGAVGTLLFVIACSTHGSASAQTRPGVAPGGNVLGKTLTVKGVTFEYPGDWAADVEGESVKLRPRAGTSGQGIFISVVNFSGRCADSAMHQEWVQQMKPSLVEWHYAEAPKEEFPSGPSMSSAFQTYRGQGVMYLTTICNDGTTVGAKMLSDPEIPATVSARTTILTTLAFGGPASLLGSWWDGGGWNLTFRTDGQVISQRYGQTACYGSFSKSEKNIMLSWPACGIQLPPIGGTCRVNLSKTRLSLDCPHGGSWNFKRSQM